MDWWANPRIPITPERKLQAAWIILAITLIAWLALTITALDIIVSSDVSAAGVIDPDRRAACHPEPELEVSDESE